MTAAFSCQCLSVPVSACQRTDCDLEGGDVDGCCLCQLTDCETIRVDVDDCCLCQLAEDETLSLRYDRHVC